MCKTPVLRSVHNYSNNSDGFRKTFISRPCVLIRKYKWGADQSSSNLAQPVIWIWGERRLPFGDVKWTTLPSDWKRFTSSIPGIVFTPNLFNVLCNRLSSVVVALCTAFFFLKYKKLSLTLSVSWWPSPFCKPAIVQFDSIFHIRCDSRVSFAMEYPQPRKMILKSIRFRVPTKAPSEEFAWWHCHHRILLLSFMPECPLYIGD